MGFQLHPIRLRFSCRVLSIYVAVAAFIGAALTGYAQDFRVIEVGRSADGKFVVEHETVPGAYYILYRSDSIVGIYRAKDLGVGVEGVNRVEDPDALDPNAPTFFKVEQIPSTIPYDSDSDGIDDYFELLRPSILDPMDSSDALGDPDEDGLNNLEEYRNKTDPQTANEAPLSIVASTSPAQGETGIAPTRESIVTFSGPLAGDTELTSNHFFAEFSGDKLDARISVSADGMKATLFYEDPLPASALIRVTFNGDGITDAFDHELDADADGEAGGAVTFDFETLNVTTLPGTIVCGRVFASELAPVGSGETSVNVPLAGVTVTVDGQEETLFAVTDETGDFRLEPAPVGRFFVHVNGKTATNGVPENSYYPSVGKTWQSVAGREVNIGNVYLPLVGDGTLQDVSPETDTVVRFPNSVVEEFPDFADVSITVPAGSLLNNDGSAGGQVGIAPVPPDRLPGTLPANLDFPLVITVQTDGATNFDVPAPVCFPNLPDPDTGGRLDPGAKTALWSFNHDAGRWEVVGSMTISADGLLACSDPGIGILAPGWHGVAPGAPGEGGPILGPPINPEQEKGSGSPAPGAPSPEDCGDQSGDGDDVVDPVYLFSGEFYHEEQDLRIKGRGLDFVWSRKYRSKIGPNTSMGTGWDYTYNIFIERDGADLVVGDGNSRGDRYELQPNGNWQQREFFRDLEEKPDGTFSMNFADQGAWVFHPFDGSPVQGKIRRIVDRNRNQLLLNYDEFGRLAEIIDTLGRSIDVTYDEDGFIENVTDFTGRRVRYTYYQDSDIGGSLGDLKSVTRPAVTGTPNGNNFPSGKTVSYTYSKDHENERLNHNLLTITDGRRNHPTDPTFGDGPWLRNIYATTFDEQDPNFDRIVRQVWGGAGGYYRPRLCTTGALPRQSPGLYEDDRQ